jgi:hypothetical protein
MLTGGCYCGAVRYTVAGTPFNVTNCHCSICRRTTGAPFMTWFTVGLNEFHILHGQPQQFHSSARGVRSFCGRCGTHLTFQFTDGNEIDVACASLDDPNQVAPADNTRTSSRLSWIVSDGNPDYPETRD